MARRSEPNRNLMSPVGLKIGWSRKPVFSFEIHYELPFCCDFVHETPVILRHADRSTVDLLVTFSSLRVFNSARIP